MGNRIKTGVAYVVKLLPIAIELIEKYRGTDEKKDSPEYVFPVGEYNAMRLSLVPYTTIGGKLLYPESALYEVLKKNYRDFRRFRK